MEPPKDLDLRESFRAQRKIAGTAGGFEDLGKSGERMQVVRRMVLATRRLGGLSVEGFGGARGPLGPRHLKLNARFSHCAEGVRLPVRLLHLLPHDHVEAGAVLVAKDEARVVVVGDCVHVERAFEVHAIEGCVTWEAEGAVRKQWGSRTLTPTPTRAPARPRPHPSRVQTVPWAQILVHGPAPIPTL